MPLCPSLVAVMVAVPGTTAVTRPVPLTVPTSVLSLAHVTVRSSKMPPFASLSVTVSWTIWPTGTLCDAGLTTTDATGARITVSVAVPLRPSLVAVTVAEPTATPVTTPLPLTVATAPTVPGPATTAHVGAMATTLPPASGPTAVNCCVPVMGRVTGVGVTVMVANGPVVTTTVAVPETCPLVAWTVFAKVPGPVPAVNNPVLLMTPPPATTDQTGEIATAAPSASLPTAMNRWVSVMASETLGVTVMLASVRGPAGE